VQFKDLNNWAPFASNARLSALGDKLAHMIFTGKADSIKPMLTKIVTGRIKTQYKFSQKRNGKREKNSLGKGSFRWNDSAIILTNKDILFLKQYFEI